MLHVVSADGKSAPNPLLIPLLARGNRQRIESQVLTLTIGDARFAVVRQSGLPVHEVALSRQRFSMGAISEAKRLVAEFKPDVLHAWGSTAQLLATRMLAKRGKETIPVVWSITRTTPSMKSDGWLEKRKLAMNLKAASQCQRIVYSSAVSAANHRRAGLPEEAGIIISPGVDAERFRPDDAARDRVRQQLELPKDAVLVGMYAPFQPEFDHATFLKAIGELIRLNPNLYCVLAGRGTAKGNAALGAMIGGGVMGTRTRLVGEWTDLSALFNACDVVCSTAQSDATRLTLAISMLCGTMCAATSVGAQGEVLGNFGAQAEPGSIDAMARGIRRILDMPAERKAFMAQAARNHILQNFNMTRSIEKYHELYIELATGEATSLAKEAESKDSPAAKAAAEIITNRAYATTKNLSKPAPAESESQKPAEIVVPSEFGTVQANKIERPAETPGVVEASTDATATIEPVEKKTPPKSDNIDFEVLNVAKPVVHAVAAPVVEEAPTPAAHWTDDDAKLMDEILVEADPETAKLNAAKAAAAEKAKAAKAAANAAIAAALANSGDAAKSVDPKVLAAALNLGGTGNKAPRAVAGKPPPPPETTAKAK